MIMKETDIVALLIVAVVALVVFVGSMLYKYNVNKDALVVELIKNGTPPAVAACVIERDDYACDATVKVK